MGRIIGSVVAGYVLMVVVLFVVFTLAWVLLGAEGAFRPDSWDISPMWIGASIVAGFVAAVAGGYLCAVIARDPRGPRALIVTVLVLGVLFALPLLFGAGPETTGARPPSVGMFDAMSSAQQPVWIALLNPVLGVLGVMLGARLRQPGEKQS